MGFFWQDMSLDLELLIEEAFWSLILAAPIILFHVVFSMVNRKRPTEST